MVAAFSLVARLSIFHGHRSAVQPTKMFECSCLAVSRDLSPWKTSKPRTAAAAV